MEKFENKKDRDNYISAAIRALVIDEINEANSGHPGMALDATNILIALYRDHLVASPTHPDWVNRDRLVYSSGHISALVYAMLHVTGYDLSLDDLKKFRQLGSKTPGHPEISLTPGVDASSGPLGQGVAQAVGMALAEKHIAAMYEEGDKLMNHYTYCICGDGCLEEGISQEAISIAGHNRLNKLILIYDENGSTLDGPTSNTLTENTELRFLASEWNVIKVDDGNDIKKISKAIKKAKKSKAYPTLIIVKTKIGYGTYLEGSNKVHGSPLGEEKGIEAKKFYGYNETKFTVPDLVYEEFKKTFIARGDKAFADYQKKKEEYVNFHKDLAQVFDDSFARNVDKYLENIEIEDKDEASRESSGRYLDIVTKKIPFMFGGSADVAGSTKTNVKNLEDFSFINPKGSNMNWGIREFAMAACSNGILLHGGLVTYEGLFLIFADYMKPAIRMGAIEELPAIYIFTHDSISVGEDGLTHQPIEQLASLRSIPNFVEFRPADCKETFASFEYAIKNKVGPVGLVLSRQKLPVVASTDKTKVAMGAYKVIGNKEEEFILIATGSEVNLAVKAAEVLSAKGIKLSVVSMPSMNLFEKQDEAYKNEVLSLPIENRISLEMGSTFRWSKYAKYNFGIDTFGASGKEKDVIKAFGFDLDTVCEKIEAIVNAHREEVARIRVEEEITIADIVRQVKAELAPKEVKKAAAIKSCDVEVEQNSKLRLFIVKKS